ncbi:hypothetical protein K1719_029719 [Acacia pycnantha]|nr:hypothetical protein K1719_029719 [Acacia pycnantha]
MDDEQASAMAPASPTQSAEVVPETQLTSDPAPAQDVQMDDNDNNVDHSVKVPSFKDKLLNLDSKTSEEEDDDIVLKQGDVSIGLNGSIPTVDFASHVLDTLNRKMGLAVVIKLLGRRIGYRPLRTQLQNLWKPAGQFKLTDLDEDCFLVRFQEDLDYQNALLSGPWMVYGHYLTVQPWTPAFKPQDHVINQVMGWIRLPKLPARYYHKSVIRSIGSVFGEVIRVDYNTGSGERGKFARIAVSIDLTKPLISKIMVDGETIYVEYEGLPSICFSCGKYGHLQAVCPVKMASTSGAQAEVPLASESNAHKPELPARESSEFGSWMQVQRRRRNPVRGDRPNEAKGSKKVANAARYEILREIQEDEVHAHDSTEEKQCSKVDTFTWRKKGAEVKRSKKPNTGTKNAGDVLPKTNLDCLFQSTAYVASIAPTSLDHNLNSAIHIVDPRSPRRAAEPNGPVGEEVNKPNSSHGNDPLSTSRGHKLSSGITIHKLGSKPNLDKSGPSRSLMKQVENEAQIATDAMEDDITQAEGVDLYPNLPL